MAPSEITRAGILRAIDEHDRLGVDAFRATYGFDAAATYLLVHEGRQYDSKAIAGVAHKYDFGEALKPSTPGFSGGLKAAVAWLRREGFTVVELPKTFHRRVGDLRPARRAAGTALHRPVLLLWAIGQAVAAAPRMQQWEDRMNPRKPVWRHARLLYTSETGGAIRRGSWAKVWARNVQRANAHLKKSGSKVRVPEDTTLHDLRHFYASVLIKNGATPKQVQMRLGHAKPSITLNDGGGPELGPRPTW